MCFSELGKYIQYTYIFLSIVIGDPNFGNPHILGSPVVPFAPFLVLGFSSPSTPSPEEGF